MLEDHGIIDDIHQPEDDRIELMIFDAGITTEPEERYAHLVEKLKAYAYYVVKGDFKKDFPGKSIDDVAIRVMCRLPPTEQMTQFDWLPNPDNEAEWLMIHYEHFPGDDDEDDDDEDEELGEEADDEEGVEDPHEFIAKIPEYAEKHVSMSEDNFGVKLDYSPASLRAIDEIISEHWEETPTFLDQVVLLFGAYVGETIRRQHGGNWTFDEENGYALENLGGTGARIYPFAKVNKRFVNGEEDSIAFYYQAVSKVIVDQRAGKGLGNQ
jgi:hypothetical protein